MQASVPAKDVRNVALPANTPQQRHEAHDIDMRDAKALFLRASFFARRRQRQLLADMTRQAAHNNRIGQLLAASMTTRHALLLPAAEEPPLWSYAPSPSQCPHIACAHAEMPLSRPPYKGHRSAATKLSSGRRRSARAYYQPSFLKSFPSD